MSFARALSEMSGEPDAKKLKVNEQDAQPAGSCRRDSVKPTAHDLRDQRFTAQDLHFGGGAQNVDKFQSAAELARLSGALPPSSSTTPQQLPAAEV